MNLQYNEYEQYFKIIIVGNTGCGKTSMIQTYDKGIKPNHVIPTIGMDYCSKIINVGPDKKIKLQIWDTAGQQQYRAFTLNHYKNSAGALVVFDVTNRNSFNDANRWILDIRQRCSEGVIIGLVGNKIDNDSRRTVTREQGETLASNEHLFYMETSISDLNSLKNVFQRLAKEIYSSGKARNLQFSRSNVELTSKQTTKDGNCQCCK